MTTNEISGLDGPLIDAFVKVFRGRADVYGSAKAFCVHEPLTRAVFERHLLSANPADHIGVYCMLGEQCSWGCIDIDGKDFPDEALANGDPPEHLWDWERMLTLARNLELVLSVKGIKAFIERTKNGYHVWVFPEQPLVPAATMRRALMAACVAIGYNPNEVNPKAEGPRPGTKGYGNMVRLPYGGYLSGRWQPANRYFIYNSERNGSVHLEAALTHIEANRASLTDLEAIAELWTPPPVAHHELDYEAGLDAEPIVKLLDGKAYTIWKDGPLPGSDRSTTLARLAHLCAERGITATQAFAVLKSADVRWGGKFANRPDGPEQLGRLIENAYA